ncbi:translation initiation factor 3 [Roseovarius nitratireducens]|uniref:translation initiation factor 3 n=1 Tax=Roseovarius nitratireducens TaxID=2044597 RepID=UPI0013EDADCA|nr:translation initiation factor 3 [Roseovarius nitratireducens]
MKNLVWIVVAVVVLGGGYLLITGKSVTEVVEEVSQGEIDAPEALEEAKTAAGEAADTVTEAAQEAAEAAGDAAGAAVEAAEEAASDAAEAVTETATDTVDAAEDAVTGAAGDPAADAVPEDSTESLPEAQDAGTAPDALTAEGFDLERALSLIEGADLGAMQENLLIEGIKAAQDNPDLLRSALEAAREALGY